MVRYIPRIYLAVLIVAVFVSAAVCIGVLHQAGLKKQDEKTQKSVIDISDKLYGYTDKKQSVPESLAAAGIRKVPSAITYKKLTSTKYKICADYKTAYAGYTYKKGKQCDTATAYLKPFVKNSDGGYTVCGVKTSYFSTDGLMIPLPFNQQNTISINNMLFIFSADSKAFNENCEELKQSDLHIGDKLDAFTIVHPRDASGNMTRPATTIFLKRTQ
jgi:hypothetical protein